MSAEDPNVVGDSRMMLRGRILLAIVSGMSVWPLHFIAELLPPLSAVAESAVMYVLVGGVFGSLVLGPLVAVKPSRLSRIALLIIGSILIYASVVDLADRNYGALNLGYTSSIVTSGVFGALLVGFLATVAVPFQSTKKYWIYLTIAGSLGGLLFSFAFESNYSVISAAGYAAWQASVCMVLNLRRMGDI